MPVRKFLCKVCLKFFFKENSVSKRDFLTATCGPGSVGAGEMVVKWRLRPSECLDGDQPVANLTEGATSYTCDHEGQIFILDSNVVVKNDEKNDDKGTRKPLVTIFVDGYYMFLIEVGMRSGKVDDLGQFLIEMIGPQGYLSAADWPLLPFYGTMCVVYVILGIIWLTVSFLQWRDLLRIQFWICAVILLGMLEKAMFYAEYQRVNSNGVNKQSVVLFAEWVSCAKRTLARMLVIIVSLGFGIVK